MINQDAGHALAHVEVSAWKNGRDHCNLEKILIMWISELAFL